jgi:DNA modification methylase
VLDPFAGTGTTLAVATGLNRDVFGIDLDERNYAMALDRVGMFLADTDDAVVGLHELPGQLSMLEDDDQ